jgi:hypothetical protein
MSHIICNIPNLTKEQAKKEQLLSYLRGKILNREGIYANTTERKIKKEAKNVGIYKQVFD